MDGCGVNQLSIVQFVFGVFSWACDSVGSFATRFTIIKPNSGTVVSSSEIAVVVPSFGVDALKKDII